jgi:hypothetical protein
VTVTKAQRRALEWLAKRNGDGIFDVHGVLVAAGERAPFMRSTWNKLRDAGLVEIYRVHSRGASRCKVVKQ